MRLQLFLATIILSTMALSAQSITVAPSESGQLYPQIEFNWTYGTSSMGSLIRLKSMGNESTDREELSPGYDQSLTIVEDHLFADLVPLYYSFGNETISVKPGLGLKADWFDIQEVGFMDLSYSGSDFRLFFFNDRQILAIRPGIYGGSTFTQGELSIDLDGFYSPVFFLAMNQEFSSAAQGSTDLDTPITTHEFSGNGFNAWGAFLAVRWDNKRVPLTLKSNWEGYTVAYDSVGIGGQIYETELNTISVGFDILTELAMVEVKGSSPQLGIGWSWDGTQIDDDEDWDWEDNDLQIYIGINH